MAAILSKGRWVKVLLHFTNSSAYHPLPFLVQKDLPNKTSRAIKSRHWVHFDCTPDEIHLKIYEYSLYSALFYCYMIMINFNPLHAIFFRENISIYLHLMPFLHTNKTQAVEIPSRVRQWPAYSTYSISWLLMSWRRKEPGHQQPWYWPS